MLEIIDLTVLWKYDEAVGRRARIIVACFGNIQGKF